MATYTHLILFFLWQKLKRKHPEQNQGDQWVCSVICISIMSHTLELKTLVKYCTVLLANLSQQQWYCDCWSNFWEGKGCIVKSTDTYHPSFSHWFPLKHSVLYCGVLCLWPCTLTLTLYRIHDLQRLNQSNSDHSWWQSMYLVIQFQLDIHSYALRHFSNLLG